MTDSAIDPEAAFRAKLAAIVEREVKAAHADILRDLASAEDEVRETKLALADALAQLRLSRDEINALRGVRTYDVNGVVVP